MADGGDDIFVYMGGDQEVPFDITHAIIDPSVNTVRRRAFFYRRQLVSVIFHDGVEIIEEEAFCDCKSLSGRIKLVGVREIGYSAFICCTALSDVEFGDRLETIGHSAFQSCKSLRSIKMPSVRTVQRAAFIHCEQLTDVEFGRDLESIGSYSFYKSHLQRITIPLKDGLFPFDIITQRYGQFGSCVNLTTVDLVGAEGVHKIISSLLMESWKNDMNEEIDRIKQGLPGIHAEEKTNAIRQWVISVINRMEHYKAEHNRLLKEHITQLELAIWKTRLDAEEEDGNLTLEVQSNKANTDTDCVRKGKHITSGADTIIKNVLPFLKLA